MKRNKRKYHHKLDAKINIYYTVANGNRIYTDEDGIKDYKDNIILDPKHTTYTNLFINGVLQPNDLYTVNKGLLIFESDEPPEKGTPIILQFVKIYIKKNKRKRRVKPKPDEE